MTVHFRPRLLLGFALVLAFGLAGCSHPDWGPGVVAPDTPEQTATGRPDWQEGPYRFHALAEFKVRARVLSIERYHAGADAKLSPMDFALGWGNMSDEKVLAKLKISQGGRWYNYRWDPPGPPIPVSEIIRSSANMHMVPAEEYVGILLDNVKVGQVVTLEGALVAIQRADGWHWKSSTSRSDSGGGACELIWVESVKTEDAP